MKKITILLIAFLFFLFGHNTSAQKFDWQYSARMPQEIDNLFIGLKLNLANFQNTGDFSFINGSTNCCSFGNAQGMGIDLGIKAEYWYRGNWAFFGDISYLITTADFRKREKSPLRWNSTIVELEYQYDVKLSYLNFEFGARRKINNTNFSFAGSISTQFLVSNGSQFFDQVISPSSYRYSDGSQRIEYPNAKIEGAYNVYLSPNLFILYDMNLGNGIYMSPHLKISLPTMSVTDKGNWRRWGFSLGVNILHGISKL